MKIINIEGTIGWETTAQSVRDDLRDADGEDVIVEINSPGGYISEGLTIFNILKNYSGRVDTKIIGHAASMATYIAMVGQTRSAENNAVFMIHNGWGIAIGDHREMLKYGNHLNSLTGIIAKQYAASTDRDIDELRLLMDDETYFYGDEIKEAGFVTEMADADDTDSALTRDEAMAAAKIQISGCKAEITDPENFAKDISAFSKMLAIETRPAEKSTVVDKNKTQEGKKMDLEKLKKDHPDVYAKAFEEGVENGTKAERDRVVKMDAYRLKFPKLGSVIDGAIAGGKDMNEFTLDIMSANQSSGVLDDATDETVDVDGDDGTDAPEMKDGEITHESHLDQVAEKNAKLLGVKLK